MVAYAYEGRLSEGLRFQDFALARAIRLYPMAWIGMLLGLLGILLTGSMHLGHPYGPIQLLYLVAAGLLLLPNLSQALRLPYFHWMVCFGV